MWNIPTGQRLNQIPSLYETEDIPLQEKQIHLHFFVAGCDWYIAEYDGKDLFWGFAILNNDHWNAEWGYISFKGLKSIRINGWLEIDCETELSWQIKPARKIENICKANGWKQQKCQKRRVS